MFRDAYMTEVIVTLKPACDEKIEGVLMELRQVGLNILVSQDSVVEGVLESVKVQYLEKLECVQYVRKMQTYAVDYPEGDPRDRNNGISGEEPSSEELRRKSGKTYP